MFAPTIADDPVVQDGWARYLRSAATPGTIRAILEVMRDIDVRDMLPEISCPTLVLHRSDDKLIRADAGRDLAERIPNAKYVELPGQDHWWFVGNPKALLNEMQPYLVQPGPDS